MMEIELAIIYVVVGVVVSGLAKRQGFYMEKWWQRIVAMAIWPIMSIFMIMCALEKNRRDF